LRKSLLNTIKAAAAAGNVTGAEQAEQ
jgi:hypothetical protein